MREESPGEKEGQLPPGKEEREEEISKEIES